MNRILCPHRMASSAAIAISLQCLAITGLCHPGGAGGGLQNTASGTQAVVGGGFSNTANGVAATVGGGTRNATSSNLATISGGGGNTASGVAATVGGGITNTAGNDYATVGGGALNTATGLSATVGGGGGNTASSGFATVGGGLTNTAGNDYATVGGGALNTATGLSATVGGGEENTASGEISTSSGGYLNLASGEASTIGGGYLNEATGETATIAGGDENTNNAHAGFIGGGWSNRITAAGTNATIGGGLRNAVAGRYAFLGGGNLNTANGVSATVGGGFANAANANFSAVPGGARGKALHPGSFVWSGVNTVDTVSTNANSFTVRAPGGVRFITSATATNLIPTNPILGVILRPGTTAWTALSDRESKTDFQPIKPREVLSKLASMPVTSWQYKHDPSRRYIGPTSQDFMAAFHLGDYDKGINTLDADGVTFAAIQGLVEELKERDRAIEELKAMNAKTEARNGQLSREIEAIKRRLNSLPPAL